MAWRLIAIGVVVFFGFRVLQTGAVSYGQATA